MFHISTALALASARLFVSVVGAQSIIYVDDSAPPGGDGASWNSAFNELHLAFDVASEGDEVLVGQGTYWPQPGGRAAFAVLSQMKVRGGFAGYGAANPDARNIKGFKTILSGDRPDFDTNFSHVLTATMTSSGTLVEGFTITGGGNWFGEELGGGILLDGGSIIVRHCTFQTNRAFAGGAIYARYGSLQLEHCDFYDNVADIAGGAVRAFQCDAISVSDSEFYRNGRDGKQLDGGAIGIYQTPTVQLLRCRFDDNVGGAGGGINVTEGGDVTISDCQFDENTAPFGVGGALVQATRLRTTNCIFRNNDGGFVCGGMGGTTVDPGIVANCVFEGNIGGIVGGGFLAGGDVAIVNCVFLHNSAAAGGGILIDDGPVINCTFYENEGGAIAAGTMNTFVANSILWNDSPTEVTIFVDNPPRLPSIEYSNVQGGWTGAGNIDADPRFVQPGTRNFRLGHGSPCLDAGNTSYLPADLADLDGDGNTTEPLPIDLAGSPRIANGNLDMGAYEGNFDLLPRAAMNDDFDPDEWVGLVPDGGDPADESTLSVRALNMSSQQNSTIIVTDLRGQPRLGSAQPLIYIETDVPAGQLLVRTKLPFDLASLDDADPVEADLTRRNESTGEWSLAPAMDTILNPTFNEPIGQRYVVVDGGTAVPSTVHGDYGVYYNSVTTNGYVWAITDRGGEYSLRAHSCPADGAPYGGNGVLDVRDLFGLLAKWGSDDRWYDPNGDGVVDGDDLMTLFSSWGVCE